MRFSSHILAASVVLANILAAPVIHATDFGGSATIIAGTTDNRGFETENLEQRYAFRVFQPISPYLSANLSYNYFDLTSTLDGGAEFGRTTQQPRLDLRYTRRRLSAMVSYYSQLVDQTSTGEYETRSFLANVAWSPNRAPRFLFNFRKSNNTADAAVFGTETDTTNFTFQTFFQKNWYSVNYTLGYRDVNRPDGQIDLVQTRHDLRGGVNHRFLQNRLRVSFGGSLGRTNQTTSIVRGATIDETVPAREGLLAIDITPEVGELDPRPELVDGDITVPVPGGDIGGGNTFRNIGLDLGVTSPVSSLEIAVDRPSGPSVQWQVYQSDDNLLWQRVGDELSQFDAVLLRYTIRFPQTTNRYLKAVNVSPNLVAEVSVTEIRALLRRSDLSQGEEREQGSTLYTVEGNATYSPIQRLTLGANVGFTNEQSVVEGFTRRQFKALNAAARLGLQVTRALRYDFTARVVDSENGRQPVLYRTERIYGGGFTWIPRPSVNAYLRAHRRSEYEVDRLIQTTRTVSLGAALDLLPDLRSVTSADFSQVETQGFDRGGITWNQRFEMRPAARWTVGVGIGGVNLETPEGQPVLDRTDYFVDTVWTPTHKLSLRGGWRSTKQVGGIDDFRQNYGLAYSPGPKLTITAAYQQFETMDGRSTATDNAGVTYILHRYVRLFANLSRSRTDLETGSLGDIVTARVGLIVSF